MKAFLLAAGYGERLKHLTEEIPKPLIPVLNVASIEFSIMLIKESGITDVMCNLHHKYRDIIAFFEKKDFFGLNIRFSIENEILGTGGGLKKCESFFALACGVNPFDVSLYSLVKPEAIDCKVDFICAIEGIVRPVSAAVNWGVYRILKSSTLI